jgi:peptide/nickel transport system permease protein
VIRYTLRRLSALIPLLIGMSIITFAVIRMLPGDAVDAMGLDARISPETQQLIRENLGLEKPFLVQYWEWANKAVKGNLGLSVTTGASVSEAIAQRMPVTLELVLLSVGLGVAIAVPFGVLSASFHERWPDRVIQTGVLGAISIPNFWLATILMLFFSVYWHLFPVFGYVPIGVSVTQHFHNLVLPALSLSVFTGAAVTRMMRASMLEVREMEFLDTARAKGLSELAVTGRHALRNASVPVVTLIGLQIGTLLGGAVVVEHIFAIPGLGAFVVTAVKQRDFTVIQGTILVLGVAAVLLNLIVDLVVAAIDPRIRLGKS